MKKYLTFNLIFLLGIIAFAQHSKNGKLKSTVNSMADQIENKVIEWRRDFHQNPELSNREFKTSEKITRILKEMGLEVQNGIAHTGVVGILKGGKPGQVVGLRADMDALPVQERTPIPFASKAKGSYNNAEVSVMHACGHDTHMAMLLGAAEILSGIRKDIKGTVKFIFQPAEEGAPLGEEGGAELMVKEGVLENPVVDAIFGIHISASSEVGTIEYRPEGILASANSFSIKVIGRQAHGSAPWTGIDPIVTSAQIINSLQTIISRYSQLTKQPAVVTIGSIHGGVRNNIIPEEVEMVGTIRALDNEMRDKIFERIKLIATKVAESQGATAEVTINRGIPITYNNPELTAKMLPSLQEAAGKENVKLINAITGAEDFSFYQEQVPGLFFFVGGMPKGNDPNALGAQHHTPDFYIEESGLKLGVKALTYLTIDFLNQ